MTDSFGRTLDYLRISITDRCNLRCAYCMPESGVCSIAHEDILTYEEFLRVIGIFAGLGVRKLKISGGEPLVRKDAPNFIRRAKRVPGIEQVTLTTNGVLLARELPKLLAAGIDGINVSLDTLRSDRYASITRIGTLSDALAGIDAAYAAGIRPLKLNTVLLDGINDDEIITLAELARNRAISVRFIELMPLGLGTRFQSVPGSRVLEELAQCFGEPVLLNEKLGNGPAVYYSFPGFAGKIGLIDAISHTFCAWCNRVRLTADGQLRLCLQYEEGCDLRAALRGGCDDPALQDLILNTVRNKPAQHCFGAAGQPAGRRTMNAIGG